ncbi:SURF1-domain-containing protein [Auriscalpium vulgare]|uniref:SURF1-domain-containing protein n=1 Tax=Auriscalpium vulgare TaxID=40419 RepID=A0ACB8S8U2_9AGAM|nr:SURF1-domain-containing protein [Auriscalpium vulgare]
MASRLWGVGLRQGLRSHRLPRSKPWATRFEHTQTAPQYTARRSSLINPTMIILGTIPVFTFALGTWQVQRLKWKVALIDELTEKLEREPIVLPNNVNIAAIPEFVYRKVILRGKWDHSHTMLLGPRVRDGAHGYHVITPLVRPNGSTVLVDRGFVDDKTAKKMSAAGEAELGEVEIRGMLRESQARNNFTPDNHPDKGEWYWADVDAMVEHAGGERANVQPVLVEEIFEGHAGDATLRAARGLPIGKVPSVDVRNAHASYVATWYFLSAFTSVMFVRLYIKQRRTFSRLPR